MWKWRIEVRLKVALSLEEIWLYFEGNTRREWHCWSTTSHHLLFRAVFFFIVRVNCTTKPNYIKCIRRLMPLNRGNNNRRVLVGMAKSWLWPLVRGYRLIEVSFTILFHYWPLNSRSSLHRWTPNGRSTVFLFLCCVLFSLFQRPILYLNAACTSVAEC